MTRRATKKMLRRAEEALREQRFQDASNTYRVLLARFEHTTPSLLDHAGCIFGLIRTLYFLGRDEEAQSLAEGAQTLLAERNKGLVIAA